MIGAVEIVSVELDGVAEQGRDLTGGGQGNRLDVRERRHQAALHLHAGLDLGDRIGVTAREHG
jgi:hypothetical protein